MKSILSKLLLLVGTCLLVYTIFLGVKRTNPSRLNFKNYSPNPKKTFSRNVVPVSLSVKDLNIELPVFPKEIKNNVWEIAENGVSFLAASSLPGEAGNSIFYGHNFENVLGNLKNARPGQIIEIKMGDKKLLHYKIIGVAIVKPEDTEVLKNSKNSILTLYTCTGFFDEKRLVVTAKLID